MVYDPKTDKFPYPEDTASHYLHVKKDNGNVYDKNYPYIDNSKLFKFKQFWFRFLLIHVVYPIQSIRMGFRVKGRNNLRKHKQLIKKGVVSVANHVHMWDYIAIMNGVHPFKTNILAWDKNISGENGTLIRMVGGIPVPNNQSGFFAMTKATINHLKNGGWLHIAAEGSMWEFYAPIRPFKSGVSYFAIKADRPIIPMAFSYRPARGIRKLFKQLATITLSIGEPIFPDKSLPQDLAMEKLTIQAHEAVCKLAGFKDGENIYPPIYNQDTKSRIDYYTNKYGINYKGSW